MADVLEYQRRSDRADEPGEFLTDAQLADMLGVTTRTTLRWRHLLRHGVSTLKNVPGHHGKRGYLGVQVKLVNTSDQHQNRYDR